MRSRFTSRVEFLAELLEQLRLHKMAAESAQHGSLERIPPDVQAVIAGALIACRSPAEELLRDS